MNINNLYLIKIKKIDKDTVIFTPKTSFWCKLPYPSHKDGCPNYDKNPLCPPIFPYSEHILDEYNYFYLIYLQFDFKTYKEKMIKLYPNWSPRQIANPLYYQGSIKKKLKIYIKRIINNLYIYYLFFCGAGIKGKSYMLQEKIPSMEGGGINVFQTLQNNNIEFEVKPKNKLIFVTLLCLNEEILES